jgi:hypothetical protein
MEGKGTVQSRHEGRRLNSSSEWECVAVISRRWGIRAAVKGGMDVHVWWLWSSGRQPTTESAPPISRIKPEAWSVEGGSMCRIVMEHSRTGEPLHLTCVSGSVVPRTGHRVMLDGGTAAAASTPVNWKGGGASEILDG